MSDIEFDEDAVYPKPPQKSDVLFAGDNAEWDMDAVLDFRPGNDYVYREGYRQAGKLLAKHVASTRGREADYRPSDMPCVPPLRRTVPKALDSRRVQHDPERYDAR